MSATVTELYDGIDLYFENSVGRCVREFLIEGLSATNNTNDLFAQAITASGIPSYTSAHPNISGLYASTYHARPAVDDAGSTSRTSIRLTVGYSTPTTLPLGGVKVEVASSNGQITLNRWPSGALKGQPILIGYSPFSTVSFAGQIPPAGASDTDATNIATGSRYDTAEIPIESPNLILILTRTEFQYPRTNLLYRRTLNSNAWLGFDPNTVLCKYVTAQNIIGAGVIAPSYYVVQYQFEAPTDSSYWQRVEFFRDQFTGKPTPGVDISGGSNNGYTFVTPYGTSDFNGLKFPNDLLK